MDSLDPELKTYYLKVKDEIKKEHIDYLSHHPEIRQLLNDFLSTVLLEKPEDVYKFAQDYFTIFNKEKETLQYKPLVISGPSGVGKGTLIKMLLERYPDKFELSVSYTTRNPRAGETHGVHYFFVTKEDFNQEIAKHSFVEYCEVHGNFYGTHKSYVKQIMEKSKICILEIDVQGAHKVSKSGAECHYLFVDAPSIDTLVERLKGRGSETPESLAKRVKNAEYEIKIAKETPLYEKFVVNEDLEETFKNLVKSINELYPGLDLKL